MKTFVIRIVLGVLLVLAFSSVTVLADGGGPEPNCIPPLNCPKG